MASGVELSRVGVLRAGLGGRLDCGESSFQAVCDFRALLDYVGCLVGIDLQIIQLCLRGIRLDPTVGHVAICLPCKMQGRVAAEAMGTHFGATEAAS